MGNFEFKCKLGESTDLCFNGGVCEIDPVTAKQACDCTGTGFQNDYVMFHLNNCTVPNGLYLNLLIACSVVFPLCILLTCYYRSRARAHAKRVVDSANLLTVIIWTNSLAYFVQNGYFEWSIIMTFLGLAAACLWGTCVSEMIALPLYDKFQPHTCEMIRRSIRQCFLFIVLLNGVLFVSLAALARGSDDTFNRISVAQQIVLLGCEVVYGAIVSYFAMKLRKELKNLEIATGHVTNQSAFLEKVKALEMIAWFLPLGQLGPVIISLVYLGLGNAPYNWVFQFVIMGTCPPSIALSTIQLLRRYDKQPSSSTPHKSNHASDIMKHAHTNKVGVMTTTRDSGNQNEGNDKIIISTTQSPGT
jgi:hypothetical protein